LHKVTEVFPPLMHRLAVYMECENTDAQKKKKTVQKSPSAGTVRNTA